MLWKSKVKLSEISARIKTLFVDIIILLHSSRLDDLKYTHLALNLEYSWYIK